MIMERKYNHLVKNTMIFAIGTFGSKMISFLIIPIYTYYLTTSEFGNVDLFITTVNMLVPFMTFSIQEAIVRFLVTKEIESKIVLNNCMLVFGFGAIISVLLVPIYKAFLGSWSIVYLFVMLLILTSYNTVFSQYLRANGKNVAFTINGLIVTITTVFSNIILLVGFKAGIRGYFVSLILSQLFASIQVTCCGKIIGQLSLKEINKNLLKQMLLYSIPLVPNNLMWWIMNAGDKYVIKYFLGSEANGIYSIAMKIPTILSLLFTIFMQAWQVSALEEAHSKEKLSFFDNVFSVITVVLYLGTILIILLVEKFFAVVIGQEFFDAWKYVPFLCLATIVNCFASFSGVVYIVNKNSKKAFATTFVGAIVNLAVNFCLIRKWGLYGVAIATFIGYLIVAVIRMFDFHAEIGVGFDIIRTLIGFILILLEAVSVLFFSKTCFWVNGVVIICILLYMYHIELWAIVKEIISRGKAKRKL